MIALRPAGEDADRSRDERKKNGTGHAQRIPRPINNKRASSDHGGQYHLVKGGSGMVSFEFHSGETEDARFVPYTKCYAESLRPASSAERCSGLNQIGPEDAVRGRAARASHLHPSVFSVPLWLIFRSPFAIGGSEQASICVHPWLDFVVSTHLTCPVDDVG